MELEQEECQYFGYCSAGSDYKCHFKGSKGVSKSQAQSFTNRHLRIFCIVSHHINIANNKILN